ncbi:hypothetical protein GCM10011328_39180 [Hafnia psychrotolerans]|uniref:Uncharacterized protein n=1 Tax=Hafnia psychrotolerans TaxID=1477018 RepID=A0ABQ1H5Z5_9GAMM|nr:hypothetical protein GCM10011328_39180 [Hafnia psychrotolerans]
MASYRTKNRSNAGSLGASPKKKAVEKFFEIKGCGLLRTPYNAPPLTGNNDSSNENQVAQSGSFNPVKTPCLAREKG